MSGKHDNDTLKKKDKLPKKLMQGDELKGQINDLYDRMISEGDLSCALIGGSYLEHCLGALLAKYLLEGDTTEAALADYSFLGSAYNRRKLAYSLALIPLEMAIDLQNIAEIRNQFGHYFYAINFKSEDISEKCRKLTGVGMIDRWEKDQNCELGPKSRYVMAVRTNAELILAITEKTERRKEITDEIVITNMNARNDAP